MSHGDTSALLVTPIGTSTFTPQATVTSFDQDFASAIGGSVFAAAENTFNGNGAQATGVFQLDIDDDVTNVQFHGFLYVVGFGGFVLTDDSTLGGLSSVRIDDGTFVQSSISIGGSTYSATANYQAATNDWQLTANLPGGVLINQTVGSVNHHFSFVVPVSDGAGLILSSTNAVGVVADAQGTVEEGDPVGSSATVQLTTSGLAWGMATAMETPPLPGDFNGDGNVDSDDFAAWSSNFGRNIGATGPQGDANLDGAVDAADYVLWRKYFEEPGAGNSNTAGNLSTPEPSALLLATLCLVGGACCGTYRKRLLET